MLMRETFQMCSYLRKSRPIKPAWRTVKLSESGDTMMIVSPEYCVSRIDISCVTRTNTSDTLSFGVPSSIGGGLIREEMVSEAYTCCFQTQFIRTIKQFTVSGQKLQANHYFQTIILLKQTPISCLHKLQAHGHQENYIQELYNWNQQKHLIPWRQELEHSRQRWIPSIHTINWCNNLSCLISSLRNRGPNPAAIVTSPHFFQFESRFNSLLLPFLRQSAINWCFCNWVCVNYTKAIEFWLSGPHQKVPSQTH